jgi:hypothetical protein
MAAIIKWSIIVCALSQAVVSPAYAKLPDITAAELLKAVKHGDSLHKNVDCKYTVYQQFSEARNKRLGLPLKRRLVIHWRKEGIKDYIDVTQYDGRLYLGKPFRHVLAINGKIRMQWTPNENKGMIVKDQEKHAWAIPYDFGLTPDKKGKKMLGEALEQCKIEALEKAVWENHECYYVEAVRPNQARIKVWIDPKAGWRARHVRYWGPDGSIWHEASGEFKDYGNGVWFPMEGVFKLYGDDPNSGKRVVSFESRLKVKQVTVNADLTIKDFEIQYPRGTYVYLYDSSESYIAGVTSVAGFGEEALNPLKNKSLPDMKQFGILRDPNLAKDKMILVCFFDMNQRPSRNCMLQLTKRAQELKAENIVIVAIQASKVDYSVFNGWVEKNNIPFSVGMVQGDQEKTRFSWGVRSLPWLILTNKEHIVTAQGFSVGDLNEKMKP